VNKVKHDTTESINSAIKKDTGAEGGGFMMIDLNNRYSILWVKREKDK
jgi:hypothetical protein